MINSVALTKGLPNHQAAAVMSSFEQALAYAWGRQDAGDGPRDTDASERFAWSFAMSKRLFLTEQHWMMINLQDGFENWRRCRAVLPELLTCGMLTDKPVESGR